MEISDKMCVRCIISLSQSSSADSGHLRSKLWDSRMPSRMPGPSLEMEPVEPQSLKKLSFKSLKRALDLFSPLHGHLAPPDPERFTLKSMYFAPTEITLWLQFRCDLIVFFFFFFSLLCSKKIRMSHKVSGFSVHLKIVGSLIVYEK